MNSCLVSGGTLPVSSSGCYKVPFQQWKTRVGIRRSTAQAVPHWLCFQTLSCQSMGMSTFRHTLTLIWFPICKVWCGGSPPQLFWKSFSHDSGVYLSEWSSRIHLWAQVADFGWCGLALSLCFNSSQRCFLEWRSGVCGGQSRSSAPKSPIRCSVMLDWEGVSHRFGNME